MSVTRPAFQSGSLLKRSKRFDSNSSRRIRTLIVRMAEENLRQVTRCGHRGGGLLHDRGPDGFLKGKRYLIVDRVIFPPGELLDRVIRERTIHDHGDRPHPALENALITGGPTVSEGRVEVRDPLGGLLKDCQRQAA